MYEHNKPSYQMKKEGSNKFIDQTQQQRFPANDNDTFVTATSKSNIEGIYEKSNKRIAQQVDDQLNFAEVDEQPKSDTKLSHRQKSQASSNYHGSNQNVESNFNSNVIKNEELSPPNDLSSNTTPARAQKELPPRPQRGERSQNGSSQQLNQIDGQQGDNQTHAIQSKNNLFKFLDQERPTGQEIYNMPSINNLGAIGQFDQSNLCSGHILYCNTGQNPLTSFQRNQSIQNNEQGIPQGHLNFNNCCQRTNPYAQIRDIEDRTIPTQTGPSLRTIEIVQQTYIRMSENSNHELGNNSRKQSHSSIGKYQEM